MKLGVFFNHTGHHVASWLHPQAQLDAGINFQHYAELARTAERAKFDFLFFADSVAVRDADLNALSRCAQYTAYFEPLTLLAALSVVTKRIGLIATASTSYNEPYHVARKFASLDHLSGGRAGWNVVTSTENAEARNFGRDEHFAHAERYERAAEFVDVVRGLWDSWDDDAFLRDRASGRYFDARRVHFLEHKGAHFSVRGPLNVPRPPQGHPVLVQAGSSHDGRNLAAAIAEATFNGEITLEGAQAYYKDVKARMAKYGRQPDHMKIMPGIAAVVGRNEAEADEKYTFLQSKIHPEVGKSILSTILGYDVTQCDLDEPLPEIPDIDSTRIGVARNAIDLARRERLTVRQLYERLAGSRGKLTIKGSAERIADQLEHWFRNGAADGFILQPPHLPGSLDEFVELVLPILQERGLFRTEYEGPTLRDNLGLPRIESRYAAAVQSGEKKSSNIAV